MSTQDTWRQLNERIEGAADQSRPLALRIDDLRFAANIALSFKDWHDLTNALNYVGHIAEEFAQEQVKQAALMADLPCL